MLKTYEIEYHNKKGKKLNEAFFVRWHFKFPWMYIARSTLWKITFDFFSCITSYMSTQTVANYVNLLLKNNLIFFMNLWFFVYSLGSILSVLTNLATSNPTNLNWSKVYFIIWNYHSLFYSDLITVCLREKQKSE